MTRPRLDETYYDAMKARPTRNPLSARALLVKNADGNPARNPLVKIASSAADAMLRFAGEFGMTPVARARISAGVGYEPLPRKFDGLLA
jgi:P27 family predicted phage terminase small subunit